LAIHVALSHVTRYKYDRLVSLGPQIVRLRPAPHCRTHILSYSLRIEPADHFRKLVHALTLLNGIAARQEKGPRLCGPC